MVSVFVVLSQLPRLEDTLGQIQDLIGTMLTLQLRTDWVRAGGSCGFCSVLIESLMFNILCPGLSGSG